MMPVAFEETLLLQHRNANQLFVDKSSSFFGGFIQKVKLQYNSVY